MWKRVAPVACAVAALIGLPNHHLTAQSNSAYSFSVIDAPGSSLTVACGIDTLGRVVGYFADGSGTHGFVLENGAFSTITFPGAAWTAAYAVNTAGQIVGAYGPNELSGRHGFLRSGGSFSTIDFPGSSDTVARGLNNLGQIVGDYLAADGTRHGFLLSAGNYSVVTLPDGGDVSARTINDSGQIAGVTGTGAGASGFVVNAKSSSPLQFPSSGYTEVWGANNVGDIVGRMDAAQPPFRGFRRSGETYTVIDLPNSPYAWDGRGINDLGQVVGSFTDSNTRTHGYIATPTALKAGPVDPGAIARPGIASSAPAVALAGPPGLAGPAGPAGPEGPSGPAGPPGSGGRGRGRGRSTPLNDTQISLDTASNTLLRSANQGCYVQEAMADIKKAIADLAGAKTFFDRHPETAGAPAASTMKLDFTPPPRPAPLRNMMLEGALTHLQNAFESLASATGGDLGGFRTKVNNDIAAATKTIMTGINAANTAYKDGQKDLPPCPAIK